MSDVGILSYEYEQANELSRKLEALLEELAAQHAAREARAQVALALDGLIALLDPLAADVQHDVATMRTPVGLARRLRRERFGDQSYLEAIRGLRDRLVQARPLAEPDVRLLEALNGATENEAAATFRRMVRR